MPLRKTRGPPTRAAADPLTACLDANGTYICTAFNPRCYIIQKVTSHAANLNISSDEIANKSEQDLQEAAIVDAHICCDNPSTDYPTGLEAGYVYMNGDIGKLPSGAVYSATPEPLGPALGPGGTTGDYSNMNGSPEVAECFTESTTDGASPPDIGADTPTMPLEQLKQLLSSQLEYYFSRENLANDAYLLSQMDNDQYVPIWTVANFNQVKKLTKDIKLITEVLRESPNVQVDEEGLKVRPNHKRCIVILREIPDSTPLEEVKNLFSGEACPRLISCEFAHNSSWYVTFESDEDAQRAYRFLREEVKEFQGKPIMARIKAKPINRLNPVLQSGQIKNGFRCTPPPPPGVYDPSSFQGQQRFVYTNGTSVPQGSMPYGSQVHVYPPFQHNQPFYSPNMMAPQWGTSPAYFDIGSVFSVNGLAPQGSFSKPQSRYNNNPRNNNRNKRNPLPTDRAVPTLNDNHNLPRQQTHSQPTLQPITTQQTAPIKTSSSYSGSGNKYLSSSETQNHVKVYREDRQPVQSLAAHNSNHNLQIQSQSMQPTSQSQDSDASTVVRSDSDDNTYRPVGKDPLPPRHRRRRKDEEPSTRPTNATPAPINKGVSTTPAPVAAVRDSAPSAPQVIRGPQFDLEATAFPPLPGLDNGASGATNTGGTVSVTVEPQPETQPANMHHWGENRLSDVVKGTTKNKVGHNNREKDSHSCELSSPRACSPSVTSTSPTATPQLTPPSTSHVATGPSPTIEVPLHRELCQSQQNDLALSTSTVALTPPCSPDNETTLPQKLVPVVKCSTADKATKTDETLLNGNELIVSDSTTCPTTTNAATMTTTVATSTEISKTPAVTCTSTSTMTMPVVKHSSKSNFNTSKSTSSVKVNTQAPAREIKSPVPPKCPPSPPTPNVDLNPARLSYAQVAQHHKERLLREKQNNEALQAQQEKEKQSEKEREKDKKKESTGSSRVRYDSRDRDAPRENTSRYGPPRSSARYHGERADRREDRPGGGSGSRRSGRTQFREFLGPRSPK